MQSTTSSVYYYGTNDDENDTIHCNAHDDNNNNNNNNNNSNENDEDSNSSTPPNNNNFMVVTPPWSLPSLKSTSSKTYSRFRQHVNPLSRRYSMAAELPPNWPASVFDNVELPLYLDIGCGKGGFLLELAKRRSKEERRYSSQMMNDENGESGVSSTTYDDEDDNDDEEKGEKGDSIDTNVPTIDTGLSLSTPSSLLWPLPSHMNYLGLEIRPGVSQYAQARVTKRKLDGMVSFVGCNANVDLDRLLTLYHGRSGNANNGSKDEVGGDIQNNNDDSTNHRRLAFVSIQFPDPHFKKAHTKRRVVTSLLVSTLAKFMEEGSAVFLQSDVKDALMAMREKFVEAFEEQDNAKDGENERVNEIRSLGAARYFDEVLHLDGTTIEGGGEEYGMANPLGVPTEREKSVLANGLPIYRTMFRRNGIPYENS